MSSTLYLGADVGKENIVFWDRHTHTLSTVPNRKTNLNAYLRHHPDRVVVLEATGGYEAVLIACALQTRLTLYRVTPSRARAFAHASGQLAKTDALDAQILAAYACTHHADLHPYQPPSETSNNLRKLTRRRDELIAMRTQERNRLQAPDNMPLRASIRTVLACLERQIASIEAAIAQTVAQAPSLAQTIKTLEAVAGVGNTTAVNLIAAMPELGSLTGKAVAALAGLAPHPRSSGQKTGYRRTGTSGRTSVRRILFMATMTATRYNPCIRTFYQRLIANGKKTMLALTACARKLLVILNAKLRDARLNQPALQQS